MAQVKNPNILSRTAFIDTSTKGQFKPVPWHLVEYNFASKGYKLLWEPVDVDLSSKSRETDKVVTRLQFIDPNSLYLNRNQKEFLVIGGSAPSAECRTV